MDDEEQINADVDRHIGHLTRQVLEFETRLRCYERARSKDEREVAETKRQSREAAQTLIEELGAEGPEGITETARRAANILYQLNRVRAAHGFKTLEYTINTLDQAQRLLESKPKPGKSAFYFTVPMKYNAVFRLYLFNNTIANTPFDRAPIVARDRLLELADRHGIVWGLSEGFTIDLTPKSERYIVKVRFVKDGHSYLFMEDSVGQNLKEMIEDYLEDRCE